MKKSQRGRMCRVCGQKYAQEMGLCRTCQRAKLVVDTPETRRCVQCRLTAPHPRCVLPVGHREPHSDGAAAQW